MKFSGLFDFLKPAPFLPEITDPALVKEQYRYWRLRIFYSIYVGYVVYYFTRKSFTFVIPHMVDELGYSMADVGFLGTVLYLTYGVSKFASGILADRANPRYVMSLGLILTGLANIFFGFSSSLIMFTLFWGLNGWFQGWGWPPCTKQLTFWFNKAERGKMWSLKSTSHNVGGAVIPLLVAYCCTYLPWRWGMFVPGIIALIVGVWLVERLRDVPQSLGLPPVDADLEKTVEDASPLSPKEILFKHVLNNKGVWILSLSYFFVYVVRSGLNDWVTIYLMKHKDYTLITAASAITWFEVGGFLGVLASGWASDIYFQGRRIPFMIFCTLALIFGLLLFWSVPVGYQVLDMLLMAILGFLIFGPQLLVGLAAAEFVDKKAACTANGFAGCFAYIGAAATGYPLGKIIDIWGWNGFFITLLVCSLATLFILLPLWVQKSPSLKASQAPHS